MYDPIAIDTAALQAIGYSNPAQFFAPPSAQGKMPPEMQAAMAQAQIADKAASAKMLDAQTKQAAAQAKADEMEAPRG